MSGFLPSPLSISTKPTLLNRFLWGTGADGALLQSGGTVYITGQKNYASITLSAGATLTVTAGRMASIKVAGATTLTGNSFLCAGYTGKTQNNGGAAVSAVGNGLVGEDPSSAGMTVHCISGGSGGGGAGGGGGAVKVGGNGGLGLGRTMQGSGTYQGNDQYAIAITAPGGVGAVGNGPNGYSSLSLPAYADLGFTDGTVRVGSLGGGGGSGGVDFVGAGGSPHSGAGGKGGNGRGYLSLSSRTISIGVGSAIHANGDNGLTGNNAVDSTDNLSRMGGGGGGAGGGGGSIWVLCEIISGIARVTATGGAGAAGGAGLPSGGGNGGLAGSGGNGIAAVTALISSS